MTHAKNTAKRKGKNARYAIEGRKDKNKARRIAKEARRQARLTKRREEIEAGTRSVSRGRA